VPLAASTLEVYRRDLDDFIVWCDRAGLSGPDEIDRTWLRRYLAFLTTRGLASRTIARKGAALRRYFGWLARTGALVADPSVGISSPRGAARLPRVLRTDEIRQLIDEPTEAVSGAAPADPARLARDDAVLELLYGSGLRVSELCGLDLDSVELTRRRVTVWGKGSKQRVLPLSDAAVAALERWLRGARAEFAERFAPAVSVETLSVGRSGSWNRDSSVPPSDQGPDVSLALFQNQRGNRLGPRDVRRILDRRSP
jgi:site-specific recombinase XerD